jgi:hypothetical protein
MAIEPDEQRALDEDGEKACDAISETLKLSNTGEYPKEEGQPTDRLKEVIDANPGMVRFPVTERNYMPFPSDEAEAVSDEDWERTQALLNLREPPRLQMRSTPHVRENWTQSATPVPLKDMKELEAQIGKWIAPIHDKEFTERVLGVWAEQKESMKDTKAYYHGDRVMCIMEYFGLDFYTATAVKYILRAGKKTEERREDLEKALWYLKRKVTHGRSCRMDIYNRLQMPLRYRGIDREFQFPYIAHEFKLDRRMEFILALTISTVIDDSNMRPKHLMEVVMQLDSYIKDMETGNVFQTGE